jgi:formylglycine-generating enzyme required for sulfatase activity
MEFVQIPGGVFTMGSPKSEFGHYQNEEPAHRVYIESFYLMSKPVTQRQWFELMSSKPFYFVGNDLPVDRVGWKEVQEFLRRLKGRDPQHDYRLPSEAEWEYACRAGSEMPFHTGATISTDQANFNGNYIFPQGVKGIYRAETTPVGSFSPNDWDVHDMHGNMREWCEDRFHPDYMGAPEDGRAWIDGEIELRVLKGGGWNDVPENCRAAFRTASDPDTASPGHGFRVAFNK